MLSEPETAEEEARVSVQVAEEPAILDAEVGVAAGGDREALRGSSEPEEYTAFLTQDRLTLLMLLAVSALVLAAMAIVHLFRRSGRG